MVAIRECRPVPAQEACHGSARRIARPKPEGLSIEVRRPRDLFNFLTRQVVGLGQPILKAVRRRFASGSDEVKVGLRNAKPNSHSPHPFGVRQTYPLDQYAQRAGYFCCLSTTHGLAPINFDQHTTETGLLGGSPVLKFSLDPEKQGRGLCHRKLVLPVLPPAEEPKGTQGAST